MKLSQNISLIFLDEGVRVIVPRKTPQEHDVAEHDDCHLLPRAGDGGLRDVILQRPVVEILPRLVDDSQSNCLVTLWEIHIMLLLQSRVLRPIPELQA